MIFFGPLKMFYINEGEVNKLAHTISDECINCGACDDSCPVGAIAEAGGKRAIDADNCIDCGACVDTCPVNAISG
jgi:NAD-dependent dihydropyrimidine dehydrogenase PreA subunit